LGFLLSVIAALLASAKDFVSKQLSFGVGGTVSAFASFAFAVPFYIVLLAVLYFLGFEEFAFSTAFLTFVVLRALTDSCAELCKMHAFKHCDLSVVSCLVSLHLALLLITSPLITGDELDPLGVLGVGFIVVGNIWLVYRPRASTLKIEPRGILLSLGAAFFFSLNSCFDRLAVQVASPALSGFGMTLLAGVFLFIPLIGKGHQLRTLVVHKKAFSLRGFFEVCFMVCKLWALQYLQAPYVGGIGKLSLLVSIVGGRYIFKEGEFLKRICCGLLIIIGAVLIVCAELQG
jgi:drug/metabolite transporter (DMT)-like permease